MKQKWRQEKLEAIRWIRKEVDRDRDPWVTINHHLSLLSDSSTSHCLRPPDLTPTSPRPNTTQPLALTFSLYHHHHHPPSLPARPPSLRHQPRCPSPILSIWLTLSWSTNSMRFNQEVLVYLTNAPQPVRSSQCAELTRVLIDQTRLLRNYRYCRVQLPTIHERAHVLNQRQRPEVLI